METFSRGQQIVVLLLIFGMSLLYFYSINQPDSRQSAVSNLSIHQLTDSATITQPPTNQQPLATKEFSGAKLLTLNKPININTVAAKDLEAIPGIGPKTAENIVDYRKKGGRFKKIEDIMKVPGIKQKRFEKIKKYLTVK